MKRITGLHSLDKMFVKGKTPAGIAQAEHERPVIEAMAEKIRARKPDGKLKTKAEMGGVGWHLYDGRKLQANKTQEEIDEENGYGRSD